MSYAEYPPEYDEPEVPEGVVNCRTLLREWIGLDEAQEQRAQAILEKQIFKSTECGCVFGADERGVYVGGYAEGSDAELPMHRLGWGFTVKDFSAALDQADSEGTAEWHRWNDEDGEVPA